MRKRHGHRRTLALFVDELFSEDICVPAVLGELAQHVAVQPAQRKWAAPAVFENVVQSQVGGPAA
jgi:hypothetical protein